MRQRKIHGHTYRNGIKRESPEYNSWRNMRSRCAYPNDASFKRYGAKGITVCDRWMHSFENFLADMGTKPTPKHTIDRIDSKGNYKPSNCRWATAMEQNAHCRGTQAKPETRAKMSAKRREQWANPEARERMRLFMLEWWKKRKSMNA